jgi:uncharacterized membrane protein YidH (DUF202 family)
MAAALGSGKVALSRAVLALSLATATTDRHHALRYGLAAALVLIGAGLVWFLRHRYLLLRESRNRRGTEAS